MDGGGHAWWLAPDRTMLHRFTPHARKRFRILAFDGERFVIGLVRGPHPLVDAGFMEVEASGKVCQNRGAHFCPEAFSQLKADECGECCQHTVVRDAKSAGRSVSVR